MDQPSTPPPLPNETPEQRDIRLNKDVAAFSYVWIISVVVFASRRDSPFIQYHAKQALVLFVASIVAAMIPFIGKYLLFIPVAGMLLGFVNAAQGRRAEVPLAGQIARGEIKPKDVWKMAKPHIDRLAGIMGQLVKKPAEHDPPAAKSDASPTAPPPAQHQPTPAPQSASTNTSPPLDNSAPKP